jgi:hypothetical protein
MISLRFLFWSMRRLSSLIHWSLQAFSQASVRLSGILLFLGGFLAIGGCLEALLNSSPLAVSWVPSSWIVILGVLLLLAGMFGLYFQYILRPGIIGIFGAMILMIGAMIAVTGITLLDIFILPWMFKLIGELSGQNDQIQTAIKQAMLGINDATSTIGSGCQNSLAALIGQNCSSMMPAPSILPSANGQSMVNSLLSTVGIAPLDTLHMWGLTFLSGAPLSLGCLLLGLTFLRAELKSRKALLLLILCASLNLASTLPILCTLFPGLFGGLLVNPSSFFVSHLYFLAFFSGVLLFLSIAGLGFTLGCPWKLQIHLPRENMFPLMQRSAPSKLQARSNDRHRDPS